MIVSSKMPSGVHYFVLWFNSSRQLSPMQTLAYIPTVGWGRKSEG